MVLVWNPKDDSYCGTIKLCGSEHVVSLTSKGLLCSPLLEKLLLQIPSIHSLFVQPLSSSNTSLPAGGSSLSLHELAERFQTILTKETTARKPDQGRLSADSTRSVGFYQAVLHELKQIGWSYVSQVSKDFDQVVLEARDEKGRSISLTAQFDREFEYSHRSKVQFADEPGWLDHRGGLRKALLELRNRASKLQNLWDVMEDWDENTWVLDPQRPTRNQLYRRIALAKNCSVHIQVSPIAPRSVCECHFLGAESTVLPLQEKFNLGLKNWNTQLTPRINLEKILEIKFPLHPDKLAQNEKTVGTIETEELTSECGICYCFRLPGSENNQDNEGEPAVKRRRTGDGNASLSSSIFPDCVCENTKCGRGFHPSCLREWLQALPTTKHTFDTMHGDCPYCSEMIHVKRQ